MMKPLSLIMLIIVIAGCDPTRFSLISDRNLDCRIYSDHRLVSHSQVGFTLDPGGSVAVTYLWATQYRATFRLTLDEGEGAKILIHPVVQESIIDSGLVLTLSRNGYELREGETIIASGASPSLEVGKPRIFRAYSEEGYLELTLGCDTLYKGVTLRTESDDIIFTTLPESKVSVYGPYWRDLEIMIQETVSTRNSLPGTRISK